MVFCRTKLWCPLLLLTLKIVCCFADKGCTPAEIAEENLKKLAIANNDFALKLYHKLVDKSSNNVFFSPLSLSTTLAMLFYGARGQTAEELRTVLGYKKANLPDELVHMSFNHLLTNSILTNNNTNPEYSLNIASALLLDKNWSFLPSYKQEVQNLYQASVQDVDFQTEAAEIVRGINEWVRSKTKGKVDSLLEFIRPTTIMVILNAVYFKGTWKTEFVQNETEPEEFYNDGRESDAIDVETMHVDANFPYASVNNFQALELPYKGDNISMLILLPDQLDGLASLENNMSVKKLSAIRQQLRSTKVFVSLPKFKLEYTRAMRSDMKSLGARSIFRRRIADFSGMTTDRGACVSGVMHKAVIEVNEEGSEAAAVTGTVGSRSSRPMPDFNANHPFMFAIVDKRSDLVLFVGRVNNL